MTNLPRILCMVFAVTLLVGPYAHAQKAKSLRTFLRKRPIQSAQLNRTLANLTQRADIRLSVARLDHASLLNNPMNMRPHSTAFLFTTYKPKNSQLKGVESFDWAVTAGHTAQLGERLLLTFYNGKKEIQVYGTLVQQGPALLSDAALIKLEGPIPKELNPLKLSTEVSPQEKLTTWGYASNKLYKIEDLTFEKDNTRFLRTDFPATQKKRSGLCGGPLLNEKGQAVGIHCGTGLADKAYAASVRVIPYLIRAYYGEDVQIPIIAKDITFGSIAINERIIYIECMDEYGHLLNQEDVYDQLPQSFLMNLYQDPEVRYMRFLLGSYQNNLDVYRVLVYDKKTGTSHFEPFKGQ